MDKYCKMISKANNNSISNSSNLKINFIDESKILNENATLINDNKLKVSVLCEKSETLFNNSAQYCEEVI